ncbi:MAG: bifunctional diaminohydroxyphosphoribosylaminopyrimidine deaminase/5-amino-6-(5-phosphoribosylamino)uracil reductase RibD [Muribaculaceae bacterium]|nr:bifunctional diaminohydroxyphosphoribosylaminopyrimidine deaminase/5-amino-6-(5-phosphoribosylamino)uracil reductase RibD [Muribaculaceae bacterium]
MTVDEKYMLRALQLARQGGGHASPNPMVGAVVVHEGKIIGEGFHRLCGKAHAEVNAIASVHNQSLLPASTIFVTLEPCSHYGKTPPCAKLLIEKNIKRVVVGTLDPFEKVSGRGVAILREAGIEVDVGVLERECRELNKRFFTAHTTGLPWVLLKWAQSADGFLANEIGAIKFCTPLTQALMHRERSMVDVIIVGANTVRVDNPSLTVRHWSGSSPLRVVLDRHLSIPPSLRLLNDGSKTLIYNDKKEGIEGNVEWVKLNTSEPHGWLCDLYHRGITSVMVEGGANVLQQMLDAGTWNELRIEIAPIFLEKGLKAPTVDFSNATSQEIDGNTIFRMANSDVLNRL